jgi:outer membrane protein
MKWRCLAVRVMIWLCAPAVAFADDAGDNQQRNRIEPKGWLYGIGLSVSQEIYRGYGQRILPIPMIGYKGEKLRLFGPFVSYGFYQAEGLEISFELAPRFDGYKQSDSSVFTGMERRKSSLDFGLGFSYQYNNWKLKLKSIQDILGYSNGTESSAELSKVWSKGPIFIEPSIGLSHRDEKLVDYYYGVSTNEVTPTRFAYSGASSLNTKAGISVMTPIFFSGLTRLAFENTWHDQGVTNSPLTDKKNSLSVFLAYSRFF